MEVDEEPDNHLLGYVDHYFNLSPNDNPRYFQTIFGDDLNIMQRSMTSHASPEPLNKYATKKYVVDPNGQQKGFRPIRSQKHPKARMMLRCIEFTCVNSPMNVSTVRQNNKFWVMTSWAGGAVQQLAWSDLWQQTWRECTLTDAYYPDQKSIIDQMASQDTAVSFTWNAQTQIVQYTGSKPLLIPITPGATPTYYSSRPAVTVTQTTNVVPPNYSGVQQPTSPAFFTCVQTVNGESIPLTFQTPDYFLDSLIVKLGFVGGSTTNLIQTYYTYAINPYGPNTAASADALAYSGIGGAFLIIYPSAVAMSFGDILGSMKRVTMTCDEVANVSSNENILGRFPIGGQIAYCLTNLAAAVTNSPFVPLNDPNGLYREFNFRCLDDFGRPYTFVTGAPSATFEIAYKD